MLLEFDLEYSKKLRELHNSYPLAPLVLLLTEKCCLIIN